MKRLLQVLMAITLLLGFNSLRADFGPYDFTSTADSYTPLSSSATTLNLTQAEWISYSNATLPFSFTYNDVAYSDIIVTTYGYVIMGSTFTEMYDNFLNSSASNIVAPFATALQPNQNGSIKTELTGAAPNRVFTVQWEDFYHANNNSGNYQNINFQVKFYEGSNKIDYIYGGFSGITNDFNAAVQVGLRGTAVSDYVTKTVDNDWAFSTDGTDAGTTCTFDGSSYPQPGLKYSFTAPYSNQYRRNKAIQSNGYVVVGEPTISKVVMKVIVRTEGMNLPNATASSFTFSTAGTTNPAVDVSNAKLYFTGASAEFAATNQFGSTVASPNGNFVFLSSPIQLTDGNNYFWLTYDINTAIANEGHEIKAQCNSMVVANQSYPASPASQPGGLVVKSRLRGIYSIGTIPGADYNNLSTAFSDIKQLGMSDNVLFRVVSNISEPTSINILPCIEDGIGNYSLYVFPEGGDWTISTDESVAALVNILGAKNVTFDGQFYQGGIPGTVPGDGGNHLTLHCVAPSTGLCPVVAIGNGQNAAGDLVAASNITVKYCNIKAYSPATWNYVGININGAGATQSNLKILSNKIWNCYHGIQSVGSADHYSENIEIKNNIIGNVDVSQSFNFYGIYINYARNGIIDNNTILNSYIGSTDNYGISINNCSPVVGTRFEITNNIIKQLHGSDNKYGIYTTATNNPHISGNIIRDFSSASQLGQSTGIYVGNATFDDYALASAIENNRVISLEAGGYVVGCNIDNCLQAKVLANEISSLNSKNSYQAFGVIALGSDPDNSNITIANNVIYDLKSNLGSYTYIQNPWGIVLLGGSGFNIIHNSINIDSAFATTGGYSGGAMFIGTNDITKVLIMNNIFNCQIAGANNSTYDIATAYTGWPTGNLANTSNSNIYWTMQGNFSYIGSSSVDPRAYSTLLQWQTFTGQDAASLYANPVFGNRTHLIPQSSSPAFNAGTASIINTDFYGTQRNTTTPTIGAFEKPCQTLTIPANGAIEVNYTPTSFTWVSNADAASYKIQVSTDRFFETVISDQTVATNFTNVALQNSTEYFWRVCSFTALGVPVTYWSPASEFVTGGPIDPPTLVSPEDLSILNLSNVNLKWNSVFTAKTYDVQLSTSESFSTILFEKSGLTNISQFLPEVLSPEQNVYWRVRAVKPAYTSQWSAPRMFTTNNLYVIFESFDKATTIPQGWSAGQLSGNSYWTIASTFIRPTAYPHSESNVAEFAVTNSAGSIFTGEGILVSPCVDFRNRGTNDVPVSFWMYRDLAFAELVQERVEVYVNTTSDLSGSPVLLGSVARSRDGEPALPPYEGNNWYQYTYNVPAEFNGSSNYIIFKGINEAGDNIYIDDVSITAYPLSNSYISSITTQPQSTEYTSYSKNKQILGIQINTAGQLNLKSATSFVFNTNGSTAPLTDIKSARLYYTGTNPEFAATNKFGSTFIAPNGEFTINGDQLLAAGTNYFWLCYDIYAQAIPSNVVDGEFVSVVYDGQRETPLNSGTDSRFTLRQIMIFDVIQKNIVGSQPYASNKKIRYRNRWK